MRASRQSKELLNHQSSIPTHQYCETSPMRHVFSDGLDVLQASGPEIQEQSRECAPYSGSSMQPLGNYRPLASLYTSFEGVLVQQEQRRCMDRRAGTPHLLRVEAREPLNKNREHPPSSLGKQKLQAFFVRSIFRISGVERLSPAFVSTSTLYILYFP